MAIRYIKKNNNTLVESSPRDKVALGLEDIYDEISNYFYEQLHWDYIENPIQAQELDRKLNIDSDVYSEDSSTPATDKLWSQIDDEISKLSDLLALAYVNKDLMF